LVPDLQAFSLIEQPWLPARDLGGRSEEYGILGVLERAHEFSGLSGEVPTQTFALTRMLLAVLHRALGGPPDGGAWSELWSADRLPMGPIRSYLDRHRERFDLFHPTTPFMQVADLHTASGSTTGTTALVVDVPNGVKFFTTRFGSDLSLSYAEAARWLVHCHAFDTSGIKTGAVGDSRVRGGRGYPIGVGWGGLIGGVLLEGTTLKQTLLLNLIPADFDYCPSDRDRDLPVWEREPSTSAEYVPGGRAPSGPVDLYTWQSRRIRLIPADGRIRDALVCNGERLTPQDRFGKEPHTAWRRSESQEKKLSRSPVYMPREHDPDRQIWRGLQSLLPGASPRQGKTGATYVAPGILEWLGSLALDGKIRDDLGVRVRTVGMKYGSKSSVVDDITNDTLALQAILARQDAGALVEVVRSSVQASEAAARALGNLAGDLAAAAGGEGTGPRSRAIERMYADLDGPFRRWLASVGPASDALDIQIEWHRTAAVLVGEAGRELTSRISPACWEGRTVRGRVLTAAHASARFRRDLYLALPYARQDHSGSSEPVPA
jgi:CRISPR system Cascade subunit CasA